MRLSDKISSRFLCLMLKALRQYFVDNIANKNNAYRLSSIVQKLVGYRNHGRVDLFRHLLLGLKGRGRVASLSEVRMASSL